MAEIENICKFLKLKGFHFLESWVSECITYFKSNNPLISEKSLKDEVLQQWLLLNLRDVKVGAFPPNLSSQHKVILPGKYAVQVETLVDSGQSRYGQLQAIKNHNLENIRATAKPIEDENISRRCLTMTVTDGVHDLSAMEYEPIPALKLRDPLLLPGFKMVIVGPVTCRKGILMLKAENVVIYGGEVDALTESNRLEILLASSLGINVGEVAHLAANSEIGECLFSGVEDKILLDVPIDVEVVPICNETKAGHSKTLNLPPLSFQSNVPPFNDLLFGEDPFIDDDVLMNVPDDIPGSVQVSNDEILMNVPEDIPRTGSDLGDPSDKHKNQDIIRDSGGKKQTSINQFFNKSAMGTGSASKLPKRVKSKSLQNVRSNPFVYLAQICRTDLKCDTEYNVKAIIITLKTKASVVDDKFSLRAKICDGSLSLDVNIASQVIENIMGFTPMEVKVMVKERTSCPTKGEALKKAFTALQSRLIGLNAILNIRFFVNQHLPLVMSVEDLTPTHLIAMRSRQLDEVEIIV